jgi:hypothetical protein
MRLNLEFKERAEHAWLLTTDAAELFIRRPLESLTVTGGHLTCWVPSHLAEEIRTDATLEGFVPDFDEPDGVYLVCQDDKGTKLYTVEEAVTYSGGDVLLFLKPTATFH